MKSTITIVMMFLTVTCLLSFPFRASADDSLLASTFYGGTAGDGLWPSSVHAIDSSGNIYIAGMTESQDLPVTAGAFDSTWNGGRTDGYIAMFSPDLTTLLAATYLGGSGYDSPMAIQIASDGSVYIAGDTASEDFPVTAGSYDTTYNGGNQSPYGEGDVFVARLSSDLSQLTTATYIGGAGHDIPKKMIRDTTGRLIVAGHTNSQDFPVTQDAYQQTKAGTDLGEDCFVAVLNEDMTALSGATYLGGSQDDFCEGLLVDSTGDITIGGWVRSQDFPTTAGAYDTDYNGHYYDGFVSKFSADLSDLSASTYLGGSSWEFVYAMAMDANSNVYVAGHTASTDYPVTAGAFSTEYNSQQGPNVGDDVFITCLTPDLSTVSASTFLGGSGWENAYGLIASEEHGLLICGNTCSEDFPVGPMAWQSEFKGGSTHTGDAFVSSLSLDLTSLAGSTYFGDTSDDGGQWIQLTSQDELILSGYTASASFPVTAGAFQQVYAGGQADVFVARFQLSLNGNPTPTPTQTPTAPPTPTPTQTPTAPPTPTPTPTAQPGTGVSIWMPLDFMVPGDSCQCKVTVYNGSGASLQQHPLFVILDVAGTLFFAPSFSQTPDHYLSLYPEFAVGETIVEILPEFIWPEGAGYFEGACWYAGLTDPGMTQLIGDFDMMEFGWGDTRN